MSLLEWILIVQFAATSYLVGVIWLVQLVHYPMMAELDPSCAGESCRRHASRITPVVGVPMLIEAVCALLLILPGICAARGSLLAWFGFLTVGLLWLITFFVQVPQHARLARQAGVVDREAVSHLVKWNWLRTALWTLRLGLAAAMLCSAFPGIVRPG
ncbi:MAG: hypothetical protein J0L78_11535 [Planctomycetes bacterium]|nr:hypothetical protein [Planctomycetota bacterium]